MMDCHLNVYQYKNSKQSFPRFTRPKIIGHFSVDKDRNFINDILQLQYLHLPHNLKKVHYNLDRGYGSALCKDEWRDMKIDHLLKFIMHNSKALCTEKVDKKLLKADIVCFRGLLTCLMSTPYENREDWSILVTNWRGTTYLCIWVSEEKRRTKIEDMSRVRRFMSWGFKFEQYLLSPSPDIKPDPSKPVVETEEFCCMFNSKLGNNMLLYGAEMDGIDTSTTETDVDNLESELDQAHFVELKTNRIISNDNQNYNFKKHKLLKWWCQSFLVGIDKIFCGCRDDKGIVHEIKPYVVKEIPKINDNLWQANACMNFCNDIITFMHDIAKKNENEVLRFEWSPHNDITYKIDKTNTILTPWYCEAMNKIK